jgi:hypothetical protein
MKTDTAHQQRCKRFTEGGEPIPVCVARYDPEKCPTARYGRLDERNGRRTLRVDLRGASERFKPPFPEAHKALVQWGIWSRQRGGIFPTISSPSLWDLAKPGDPSDWVEPPAEVERVEQTEVKAEAANDEACDEKTGEALDVLIHDLDFPTVWRRCLAAAYVTREVPEHLFPREASRTPPPRARDEFPTTRSS